MRSPRTAAESCFGRVRSIEWGAVYEQCLRLSSPSQSHVWVGWNALAPPEAGRIVPVVGSKTTRINQYTYPTDYLLSCQPLTDTTPESKNSLKFKDTGICKRAEE